VSPEQSGLLLPATGAAGGTQLPHTSNQLTALKKLKQFVVVLKITSPLAGFMIALRSASVIRGISIPFVLLATSSIAETSGGFPVVLIADP
jgi:hypothetical protein